jgi:NodT family efflux transporter outer membrane factor (OMF) lipoprotein
MNTFVSFSKAALLALAVLVLAACVLPPKSNPTLKTIDDQQAGVGASATPQVEERWWRVYGDQQFDDLIDGALDHNPTLQEAIARIGVAQATAESAAGGRQPHFEFNGELQRVRYPERFIYPPPFGGGVYWQGTLLANMSWNLDFWGHQSALIRNTQASANASVLDAAAARLAIASSIAQAYLDLNRAYQLADIATQSTQQRQQILEITRKRIEAGLDTQVELREAETAVPQAELARLQAESARDLAVHRVAALAGQGGAAYETIHRPTLNVTAMFSIPEVVPLDLLGRRPDVLAARARVEAAKAQREVARTAFFPNINLNAFAGFQAIGLDNLITSQDRTYGLGPAISLPLFNSVRLKSELHSATAAEDVAIASYNATVLKAVQQVADELSLVRSTALELTQAQAAMNAAEDAYRLAQRRYQAGLANYLSVLATESQVLTTRTNYVDVLHAQAIARIALLLAVGGDFDPQAIAHSLFSMRQPQ